eukprot:scaffold126757_cov33-Phaeocystis_antarctica.AAC.1
MHGCASVATEEWFTERPRALVTVPAVGPHPFARAGVLRRHEGHEGYEYGNRPHENEGTPQLLAAEVSMGKLAATTLRGSDICIGRRPASP